MIKFTLKCNQDHQFESWFQSAEAFDKLDAAGMVSCAVCGSDSVTKALMAPRVRASRDAAPVPAPTSAPAPGAPDTGPSRLSAPTDPRGKAIADLRTQIEKNSEYVGLEFAAQARDMHDGLTPNRAIHGEAKPEEARKLIDDGVPVLPLPFVPRRKAN
ncbi:hypothetical protein FIU86_13065 [Roseovarius sp. THAF9]|uniref:DUF1178 family protein n=1 Tax=Roseovarius sp. THAF9 TaxID=2587847 RepID=UPI0012695E3B|nr:DUF1178 family protein [Roseovarius sp. THAF9]QFT93775.1 hypothetical protein FIU86_13065 [Roseovarius sp. THAF9]